MNPNKSADSTCGGAQVRREASYLRSFTRDRFELESPSTPFGSHVDTIKSLLEILYKRKSGRKRDGCHTFYVDALKRKNKQF